MRFPAALAARLRSARMLLSKLTKMSSAWAYGSNSRTEEVLCGDTGKLFTPLDGIPSTSLND